MGTGWRSRGYLPHIEAGTKPQFVTWRLEDSLPREVLERWYEEARLLPESDRNREILQRIEAYLDEGHGNCILRNPVAAKIVQDALLFHHGRQYQLLSWVVMPNHCHALIVPRIGFTLSKIMHSQKSFTVHAINKALGREGEMWQAEYYDEIREEEEEIERTRFYIEWNPVEAGLCPDPSHWPYSSANPVARKKVEEK